MPYRLTLAGPAKRAIERDRREPAAFAVLELMHGALLRNPRRVGHELGGAWQGYWTAHVGSYRVIYRILDDAPVEQTPGMVALREPESGTVTVVRIRRRADAYHGGPG